MTPYNCDNHNFVSTLSVYRSSAGSGKTRTLAKAYIKLVLVGPPDAFTHVLAVTFANKATQEMKERVLQYLAEFAAGRTNPLGDELKAELRLSAQQLQSRSSAVLSLILHRYSQFSISTIDAFFQRIIRAFTREAGLLGNFRLEVDNDLVLDEVIDALMDELGPGRPELTNWVVQFARNKLSEGASWNIHQDLKAFTRQIFNEDFKAVEQEILATTNDAHVHTLAILRAEVERFETFMKVKADEALAILVAEGLSVYDFHFKDIGTAYKYFSEFSAKRYMGTDSQRMQTYLASGSAWAAKGLHHNRMVAVANARLLPILKEMVAYDDQNSKRYLTAYVILQNFYAFGLLADVTRKLQHYKSENNVMLLADAPQFLQGVINKSDTPFIYEKVGAWFHHYLIDEFQDTSRLQWLNFIPLLKEAADQNRSNLIVGDVKQSIYRWRGGDLQLLQHDVSRTFGKEQVEVHALDTNYRSAGNVVAFNNVFFTEAAPLVSQAVANPLPAEVYRDVAQKPLKWPHDGYVRLEFLEKDEVPWEDRVLTQLPRWLEQLQEEGVALKDIAILVRKNEEGQRIVNFLLQYQQSPEARPSFRYDVVSNESLRLDTAWSVNVLVTAFRFLKNPADRIARAQLAFELAGEASHHLFAAAQKNQLAEFIPEEFILQARYLNKLSLFELTEELIRIFKLGHRPTELAYLQAFQDLILEFSAHEKTDLQSFLEWWELYKGKKSIQVSGTIDAVNIFTIHRAKGLQFKFVIIPFCRWEMDHSWRPQLWVQSKEKPFNELGTVAVTYSSSLAKTHFEQDYIRERTKIFLDNLNLLYVAFTRAEWGLLAFAPQPGKGKSMATTADVMAEVITASPELSQHFNGQVLEWGTLKRLSSDIPANNWDTVELSTYISSDWRKKMVIKRQGREFFDAEVSDRRLKINVGILLHQVLAQIHYKGGWQKIAEDFFIAAAVHPELQDTIRQRISAMMDHPVMSTWFNKQWQVKTEAPVLLPGGRQKRIDRVLIGKHKTLIIDYKTGEKSGSDAEQVEEYARVLGAMGYPNVSAYLVYLQSNQVEEIIGSSNLSLFK
jgi:ATP-dependent exoDNAse (exonuclease V) beta subunit